MPPETLEFEEPIAALLKEIDALNAQFADICLRGKIERTDPLPPEVSAAFEGKDE